MIVDSCIFFNELDMLELRLKMLWNCVDKFIIVEADRTFSGNKKPYHFEDNRARFAWAESKIIHHPLKIDVAGLDFSRKPTAFEPAADCWQIEYRQRDSILDACHSFAGDDILIMSDVDEIPSIQAIRFAKENLGEQPLACEQAFFYYNLKTLRDDLWCGSIISTMKVAREQGTQNMRNRRFYWPRFDKGGWHLSYFGDVKQIQNKIRNYSHQENNVEQFLDSKHIEECIRENRDLYNRGTTSVRPKANFFPLYFLTKVRPYDWGVGYGEILAVAFERLVSKEFWRALPSRIMEHV